MHYPELEKYEKFSAESVSISRFLSWLRDSKYEIAEYREMGDGPGAYRELYPVAMVTERLLTDYFKIDLRKVEKERKKKQQEFERKAERDRQASEKGTNEYKKLVGKKCCFCKEKLTLHNWKDDNISKLVGGSCPPRGKPMHSSCYDKVMHRLFR